MSWEYFDEYPRYESVAKRREKAEKLAKKIAAKQGPLQPAVSKGQKIATSFWGQAWNRNLERYAEYEHRLPRGRTYVKNGLVIDLKVERGAILALVSGSEVYEVRINIKPLGVGRWKSLKKACSGQIASLVGLLQGKLPTSVMEAVTDEHEGLFPEPREIQFICSCPDYADLCKHSAAAVYGVGARLDDQPELLFLLRGVDHTELIANAGDTVAAQAVALDAIADGELGDLSGLFGIELDMGEELAAAVEELKPKKKKRAGAKKAAKKA
ncbi:hypothetical protein FEM03_03140 [Phragmitibacter flavus]|uniref:SWIM-type domain-containing protein n=1 Tax=Phragmitibacter flavus TaxID=2576071 RepID=A0A5R8KJ70_9BACT|nr:hypothetical protein [Phragmitibacter flavus]TLD72366.1 hypothetical protein FEM03_03140 [Phragmitibacter flavus]